MTGRDPNSNTHSSIARATAAMVIAMVAIDISVNSIRKPILTRSRFVVILIFVVVVAVVNKM